MESYNDGRKDSIFAGVEGEDVVAQMERAFRRKVRSAHADLALTLIRLTPYRG